MSEQQFEIGAYVEVVQGPERVAKEFVGLLGVIQGSAPSDGISGAVWEVNLRPGGLVRFLESNLRLRSIEETVGGPMAMHEELCEQETLVAAGARFASQAGSTWEENSREAGKLARVSMAFSLAAIAGAMAVPDTHVGQRPEPKEDEVLQPAREDSDPDPETEPSFCKGDFVVIQNSPFEGQVARIVEVHVPVSGFYEYDVALDVGVFRYPSSALSAPMKVKSS